MRITALIMIILLSATATAYVPQDFDHRHGVVSMMMDTAMHDHPGEFDPNEYMEWCPDTDRIATTALQRMEELDLLDSQSCQRFESELERCRAETDRMCENQPAGLHACPPEKANFIEECERTTPDVPDLGMELQSSCEQQWEFQKDHCEFTGNCDKEEFMDECAQMPEMPTADDLCEEQWAMSQEHLEEMCEQQEEFEERCVQESERMCAFAEQAVKECSELSRDEILEVLKEQASFMCKKASYEAVEFKRLDIDQTVVPGLIEASERLHAEEKVMVEQETDDYMRISEQLQVLDQKEDERGVGYGLKKLIGLAAEEERQDAEALRQSAERLNETISTLEAIAERIEDEQAKQAVMQQAQSLRAQQQRLLELADEKEKKARGIFSFLG